MKSLFEGKICKKFTVNIDTHRQGFHDMIELIYNERGELDVRGPFI